MEVKLVKEILNLDEESFFAFKDFIEELNVESLVNNDSFLHELERKLPFFLSKKRKPIFKSSYYDFVKKYNNILIQLQNKDLFFEIKYLVCYGSNKEFLSFLDYLYSSYDKKDLILENIDRLEKLGVLRFDYTQDKLPNTFYIKEQNINGEYQRESFYSDGVKRYIKKENEIVVDVKNHSYFIKYLKSNLSGLKQKDVVVSNLEFDTKTLPSFAELYDKNVWQFLDKDNIEKRSEAIKSINKLLEDSTKVSSLLTIIYEDIKKLEFTKDESYKNIINKLNDLKQLSNMLIEFSKISSLAYQKKDIISIMDIEKYIKLK